MSRFKTLLVRPRIIPLAFVALLMPACAGLEFQKQTALVGFPKEHDELRILLVYEGFHATNEKPDVLQVARTDLGQLVETKQLIFLGYPWLSIRPGEDGPGESPFSKYFTIDEASLFLNRDGKLCARQAVVVKKPQALMETLNNRLSEQLGKWADKGLALDRAKWSEAERKEWEMWDRESLQRIRQAARDKHAWCRLAPGRFSFTLPGTPELFAKLRAEYLKEIASDKTGDHFLQQLTQLPLNIDQRRDRMIFSLGAGDGEPLKMVFGRQSQVLAGAKELMEYAKTRNGKMKENVATTEMIEAFLKEHAPAAPKDE